MNGLAHNPFRATQQGEARAQPVYIVREQGFSKTILV